MKGNTGVSILNPANILTMLRILLVPIYLWLFSRGLWITAVSALLVFIIAAVTDLYDGKLARRKKVVTKFGKFLDPLADKVLITTGFICLIFLGYMKIWMVVVIVMRDFVVTWLRSYGHKIGRPIHTLEIARWKTGVQTVALYIALLYITIIEFLQYYGKDWSIIAMIENSNLIFIIMFIATLFTAITGIVYLIVNKHLFARNQGK